jgi:hypothetical protein
VEVSPDICYRIYIQISSAIINEVFFSDYKTRFPHNMKVTEHRTMNVTEMKEAIYAALVVLLGCVVNTIMC